ncbi:MAG TPA: hypothetical protein VFV67_13370, partial [Actinophytocola sp.]|uniref:hypothetical protein n=1 Tax=Actinophytocola sp. TaxID=1872138 RepID=UPI002DB7D3A7
HAFRELGEVASSAICTHSASTSHLTEPADEHRRCQACLLLHGDDLADRTGRQPPGSDTDMWRIYE